MDRPGAGARPHTGSVPFIVLATLLGGVGCSSDSAGTAAPELVNVLVQVAGGTDVDLLAPPDGGVGAVSPTAQVKLVFNQLLDGDKIETILDGGGFMGMTGVASLTWTGAPAGAPAITAVTTYNPAGALSVTIPGPSVLVSPDPGLPSGAQISLALVREKITSKKGTPFVGEAAYMLETAPFSVGANLMDGETVAPDFTIVVTFSNVPAEAVIGVITLATAGGVPILIETKKDETNPLVRVLTPKDGTWPVGSGYVLTVGKDAADQFGVKLPAPFTLNFGVAVGGADGGVAAPDGGVDGGAGVPDGASDGGDAAQDAPGAPGG
jgi:hypothetical protein